MKIYIITLFFTISFFKIARSQNSCVGYLSTSEVFSQLVNKPSVIPLISLKCNFNDSIKKRLLYLLDWRWTKAEIDDYLERDIIEHKRIYNIDEVVTKITNSNSNDSFYIKKYDSIKNEIKKSNLNSIPYGVDVSLIRYMGYLNIREAIPTLYKAFNFPNYYDTIQVELTLARFGDKKLQRKAINRIVNPKGLNVAEWLENFEFSVAPNLLYISTQESIYKLNEWLDTSKIYQPNGPDYHPKRPLAKAALEVIYLLRNVIMNDDFQSIVAKIKYDVRKGYLENDLILACKYWLKKNKGKYKIYKNYTGNGSVWEWDFNDMPVWVIKKE